MMIVPLDARFEALFWKHVNQDIPDYYFFAYDWKHNKEKTEILLALEHEQIDGMMVVYDKRIAQLRGSYEAAQALLQRLDLEKVEIQCPMEHKQLVLARYEPTLKQSQEMMLMLLHKGEEKLHLEHSAVALNTSDSERIAALMSRADPAYWGDVTGQSIAEGMSTGANWLGVKVNGELASIGMMRLTEWAGLIGIVATHEAFRNRGYASSIVSLLVELILERVQLAMIFMLADNSPAVRAYTKVGFKPYRTYFFMRGERR